MFNLGERIGGGGNGEVWKDADNKDNVIKIIPFLLKAEAATINQCIAALDPAILPIASDQTKPAYIPSTPPSYGCRMGACKHDLYQSIRSDMWTHPVGATLVQIVALYERIGAAQADVVYHDFKLQNIGVTTNDELVLLDLDSLYDAASPGLKLHSMTHTVLDDNDTLDKLLHGRNARAVVQFVVDAQVVGAMSHCLALYDAMWCETSQFNHFFCGPGMQVGHRRWECFPAFCAAVRSWIDRQSMLPEETERLHRFIDGVMAQYNTL